MATKSISPKVAVSRFPLWTSLTWPLMKTPQLMGHEFSSKMGSAQYATVITRPDAAKATSHLAQFLTNPSWEHIHAISQIISYLYQTLYRAIFYKGSAGDLPNVQFFRDASFGDNSDRKSSAGYLCMIFSGPVDWKAAKQRKVSTSTTEAELLALSEARKSPCTWVRTLQAVMFDPSHSVVLKCDNQQTIGLFDKGIAYPAH